MPQQIAKVGEIWSIGDQECMVYSVTPKYTKLSVISSFDGIRLDKFEGYNISTDKFTLYQNVKFLREGTFSALTVKGQVRMGSDSPQFSVPILLHGKKIGVFENCGRGGSSMIRVYGKEADALNAYLKPFLTEGRTQEGILEYILIYQNGGVPWEIYQKFGI